MLTKQNVCLFIKDEEHLEEMREFLLSNGEKIKEHTFYISGRILDWNYLRLDANDLDWRLGMSGLTEVTTEQFKALFI